MIFTVGFISFSPVFGLLRQLGSAGLLVGKFGSDLHAVEIDPQGLGNSSPVVTVNAVVTCRRGERDYGNAA